MKQFARVVVMALFASLAGCVTAPSPVSSGETSTAGSTVAAVDPQVMSDVIAWVFPVGGPGMLRTMRVARAIFSIQSVDCGGEPFEDLDYTGDRLDQLTLPYLNLIREKGLADEAGKRPKGDRVGEGECRYRSLPSQPALYDLNVGYWEDVIRGVWNRDDVQSEAATAGRCLEEKSGWDLTHREVSKLEYYFVRVDGAVLAASNTSEELAQKVGLRYSGLFADCAVDYAAAMQSGLEAKRPGAIERNRELLTSFAAELSRAGYVP